MKKIAFGAAVAFTLGLIGLYAYAYSLPDGWTIDTVRVIPAKADVIWAEVGNLERWENWSSWGPRGDETATVTVRDSELSWTGQKLGQGRLEATRVVEGERFEYKLWFAGREEPTMGVIELTPTKGGTEVKWIDRGDVEGNPLLRLLVPRLESQLREDIERSLIRLDDSL